VSAERARLGVLDLVPISSGSSSDEAVRNAVDLAQQTERFGYRRYWFAEHHLNPGVAGSSPAILIALVAAATQHIRLGSGGVQSGHRTALSVVEEFGLIDALYPGRIDLGLGRSGGRDFLAKRVVAASSDDVSKANGSDTSGQEGGDSTAATQPGRHRTANGLLIPERHSFAALLASPRIKLSAELLQQAGAQSSDYSTLVRDVIGLLHGTYRSAEGLNPQPVPGQGARVEPWILGSSAGESASVAGELGLRFAANYHVSPATVLEAVEAYRAAFVPSSDVHRPYVAVSADVVVGRDDATARELAAGYALWVRSIRRGEGAIAFPTPEHAARHRWTDEDRALVADRVDTQFVGSVDTVVAGLERLQEATRADELAITTITHDHADRVRSYELLAREWLD
jgi:alkanesulfonate monooxygenase SsuD/methylene tetrahydromethanopterin reductase-like flavin-dependent oxidoreductase (luciferase family)